MRLISCASLSVSLPESWRRYACLIEPFLRPRNLNDHCNCNLIKTLHNQTVSLHFPEDEFSPQLIPDGTAFLIMKLVVNQKKPHFTPGNQNVIYMSIFKSVNSVFNFPKPFKNRLKHKQKCPNFWLKKCTYVELFLWT